MQNRKDIANKIHELLLDYYGYPDWRNPLPPLDELVSTILSQNTNDVNRDRAFEALTGRFPNWEDVRDADQEEVIDTIRTAGLANQKGPRIQKILMQITEQQGSLDLSFLNDMPTDDARDWLLQFKGVGPKTAAIVLQFSLGKPAFPVDTHIFRVTGRVGIRPEKMTADQAHSYLEEIFPEQAYYPAHLNIIHLGREICHARKPECVNCPINHLCVYYSNLRTRENMGEIPGSMDG
jgi:endonuclease-3